MYGLKRVSQRRDDALSRVGWEQLETLLATYYRDRGYQVDHVGTGASGSRFDGGIDLKLRRDSEYVLVQCKHWNAMKVTHNAVHELLGIMVNEGATGAILVTSGEFSKAAIEAGTRQGHVQLIDGEELRAMIGPIPEPAPVAAPAIVESELTPMLRVRNSGKQTSSDDSSGLVWKIAGGVILGLLAFNMIGNMVDSYRQRKAMEMFAQEMKRIAADPDPMGWRAAAAARQRTSPHTTTAIPKSPQATPEPYQAPVPRPNQTPAEIREARRQSEESMKIIEDSTPEL